MNSRLIQKCLFGLGALFCIGLFHGAMQVHAEENVPVEEVTTKSELDTVIQEAADQETVVSVEEDITDTSEVTIDAGQVFTFTTSQQETLFNPSILIREGGQLTLDGNILYKGSITNYGKLIVQSGDFTKVVSNRGENASFEMNGGSIHDINVSSSYSGALEVRDGATGTMNGGSVSNNTVTSHYCGSIFVGNDASFTMNGGVVENNVNRGRWESTGGIYVHAVNSGAKSADEGKNTSFVMNGGTIRKNESLYGGGVFVHGGRYSTNANYADVYSMSTFTMNGGLITENQATGFDYGDSFTGGGGGGVWVHMGAKFIMNGGEITNNHAYSSGGGVGTYDEYVRYFGKRSYSYAKGSLNGRLLSDWATFFPAYFEMNGGSISNNFAQPYPKNYTTSQGQKSGVGGGIYIAGSKAVINQGLIENNWAYSQGGGLYVSTVPYAAYFSNTLITGNTGGILGGGIWFCPTGDVEMNLNSGVSIFDNTSDGYPRHTNGVLSNYTYSGSYISGAGDDVSLVHSTWDSAYATLINTGLGGSPITWYQDGKLRVWGELGIPYPDNKDRYVEGSQDNVEITDIIKTKEAYQLKAIMSDEGKALAEKLAVVLIRNNWAGRGGGIGSNGAIIFGEKVEIPAEYTVTKEWSNETHPEKVVVWLVTKEGDKVASAELSQENNWTYTFKDLPTNIEYLVEEELVNGWVPEYAHADGATNITNYEETSYTVKKQWIVKDVI